MKRLSNNPILASFLVSCTVGSKYYHVYVTMTTTTYVEAKNGVTLYQKRIVHLVQSAILTKYRIDIGDVTYNDLVFVARQPSGE